MPPGERDLRGMMILVDEFCADMKARLADRYRAGYTGWNEPERLDWLLIELPNAGLRIANSPDPTVQALDTANYGFFLWYHYKHGPGAPKTEGEE